MDPYRPTTLNKTRFKLGEPVQVGDRSKPYYVVRKSSRYVMLLAFSGGTYTHARSSRDDPARCIVSDWTGRAKPAKVLAENRGDYWHYAVIVGKKMVIDAGCRTFTTAKRAIKHWKGRRRGNYNSLGAVKQRAKDKRLNKFSLAFVRKVERIRAKN